MSRSLRKLLSFYFVFGVFCFFAEAQESYEFVNRDINEILYAVSLARNFSVCADDTVGGLGDFRFVGDDFDAAFDSFLLKNRLYVKKEESKWTVSRIRLEKMDSEEAAQEEKYALDASDVSPERLFERIATETGSCITYEILPQIKVSIHSGFCTVEELVRRVCELCSGYEPKKEGDGLFRISRSGIKERGNEGKCEIEINEDFTVSCDLQNCLLSIALEKLFRLSGSRFCFAGGTDSRISRANFVAENIDDALSLLCRLGSVLWKCCDGIYYLSHSKNKNLLGEVGKQWRQVELKHLKCGEASELCARRFSELEMFSLNGGNSLFVLCSDEEYRILNEFIEKIDRKSFSRLVQLKYLRTSEFFANLPPFVDKSQVSDSGRGDSFYFSGTEEECRELEERLCEIDRPVSRIRYDLLIVQYQATDGEKWSPNFRAGRVSLGDRNDAGAKLGSVLNFNMDVIGAFGLKFAFDLQSAITHAKAKVYADTTLNGVSGSTINFQNTSTYRYRDNNLDPETGEPIYSGITKEIISGLKLEVTGTVSGDGMITSRITASVSRQGTDLSATTGNPPPTSEKVITTEVRSQSGEPVVLSGLVQNEETETVSRVPWISRIPLLGRLFKAQEKGQERTEMVIYLVPSAEI